MGRSFYVSGFRDAGSKDRWVIDELEMREQDRHPNAENLPIEEVPIMDPITGQQAIHPLTGKPRSRRIRRDASLGFDSSEVVFKGDRVVKIAEEPLKGGDINYYFERIADDGRSRGTYKVRAYKVAEGRHRIDGTSARRYFT